MSQVKKEKIVMAKYGTLLYNTKRYDLNDPAVREAFVKFIESDTSEEGRPIADSIKMDINSGADIQWNGSRAGGSYSTTNKNHSIPGYSDTSVSNAGKDVGTFTRNLRAFANTDAHKINVGYAKVLGSGFMYEPKSEETSVIQQTQQSEETPVDLIDIPRTQKFFEYDDNGSFINGPSNEALFTRLANGTDYFRLPKEEGSKKYRLSEEYTPEDIAGLYAYIAKLAPDYLDGLRERAANNSFTADDLAFMKGFGIYKPVSTNQGSNGQEGSTQGTQEEGLGDLNIGTQITEINDESGNKYTLLKNFTTKQGGENQAWEDANGNLYISFLKDNNRYFRQIDNDEVAQAIRNDIALDNNALNAGISKADKIKLEDQTGEGFLDSDINKSHTVTDINGITTQDWMDIGAAVGDLLGAAVSFTPAAPVGIATGYGADVTRLTADIQRDGLDLGDVGRFVLGAGLDTLAFIPGLKAAGKNKVKIKDESGVETEREFNDEEIARLADNFGLTFQNGLFNLNLFRKVGNKKYTGFEPGTSLKERLFGTKYNRFLQQHVSTLNTPEFRASIASNNSANNAMGRLAHENPNLLNGTAQQQEAWTFGGRKWALKEESPEAPKETKTTIPPGKSDERRVVPEPKPVIEPEVPKVEIKPLPPYVTPSINVQTPGAPQQAFYNTFKPAYQVSRAGYDLVPNSTLYSTPDLTGTRLALPGKTPNGRDLSLPGIIRVGNAGGTPIDIPQFTVNASSNIANIKDAFMMAKTTEEISTLIKSLSPTKRVKLFNELVGSTHNFKKSKYWKYFRSLMEKEGKIKTEADNSKAAQEFADVFGVNKKLRYKDGGIIFAQSGVSTDTFIVNGRTAWKNLYNDDKFIVRDPSTMKQKLDVPSTAPTTDEEALYSLGTSGQYKPTTKVDLGSGYLKNPFVDQKKAHDTYTKEVEAHKVANPEYTIYSTPYGKTIHPSWSLANSLIGYGAAKGMNNLMFNDLAKSINDSARASVMTPSQEVFSSHYIPNSRKDELYGDLRTSLNTNLSSDDTVNRAMQLNAEKIILDEKNKDLSQISDTIAQQNYDDTLARRQYAAERAQIANYNNKLEGSRIAALGQNGAARRSANFQSFNNLAHEVAQKAESDKEIARTLGAYQQNSEYENLVNRYTQAGYTEGEARTLAYKELPKRYDNVFTYPWIGKMYMAKRGTKMYRPISEEILRDSNKATRQAVMKYNENIIKILLNILK